MKNYKTSEIRNVVLLGAPGAGKTTFAEAMAFEGKVIDRRGSIDAENTISDNTDLEHTNRRSIFSSVLYSEFMEHKINIIDAPGSDDFCGALFSAFKVADIGIMLFNAKSGFEVGSDIQGRYAARLKKPLIGVVNHLDAESANWDKTIEEITASSKVKPAIVQYPVNAGTGFNAFIDVLLMKMFRFKDENGAREELPIPAEEQDRAQELHDALLEAAAENDEDLMNLYFETGELSTDQIRQGLKLGLANRDFMPIFCAAAKKDIGAKRLMEFIINVAPSPAEAEAIKDSEGNDVNADESKPTELFVFKSALESHVGEISYFRVVSGKIAEGQELTNMRTENKEKIAQLFAVAGKNRVKVTEMAAGDIGCTVKLKATRTDDTLAGAGVKTAISSVAWPEPRYRAAIRPLNQNDEEKLGEVLNKARYEDPSILVEYSKELKQIIVQGQGELHLKILHDQILNSSKIETEYVAPKIPYRETITKTAAADYRHKKQSGGAGQFGEVHLVVEPYYDGMPDPGKYKIDGKELQLNAKTKEEFELDWGGKLQFYTAIVGGSIDSRFFPAILKGVKEKMEEGPLTGSYARDIRVIIYDGKMHPVDSNEISFILAGRNAFKDAFRTAGPKIMEPIYTVEVLVPSDRMGDVMSDMQNRRAMVEGMSSEGGGLDRLTARVPLAELYRYSTTLSSLTNGRATYTMRFLGYEQVPSDVQEKLLKAYADAEKDE